MRPGLNEFLSKYGKRNVSEDFIEMINKEDINYIQNIVFYIILFKVIMKIEKCEDEFLNIEIKYENKIYHLPIIQYNNPLLTISPYWIKQIDFIKSMNNLKAWLVYVNNFVYLWLF